MSTKKNNCQFVIFHSACNNHLRNTYFCYSYNLYYLIFLVSLYTKINKLGNDAKESHLLSVKYMQYTLYSFEFLVLVSSSPATSGFKKTCECSVTVKNNFTDINQFVSGHILPNYNNTVQNLPRHLNYFQNVTGIIKF